MNFLKRNNSKIFDISYINFTLIMSFIFAFSLNLPILTELINITKETDSGGIIFLITAPILLFAAFNIIFQIISFPYIAKPVMVLLVITSSIASFATLNYGTIFDVDMIESIIQTDASEASSYLSFKSQTIFLLTGIVPSLWIISVKFKSYSSIFKGIMYRVLSALASIVVILIIAFFFYKDYASIGRNNKYMNMLIVPTHVYSTYEYVKKNYFSKPIKYKNIGLDAKIPESKNGKPTLTVFILGETARGENISYNGYHRNTAPFTSEHNLISFQDTESCGTATTHSVPCMFSYMNRNGYKKKIAKNTDNFLNILQHAGVQVLWLENDGGSKGVDKFIPTITMDRKSNSEYCDGSVCLDGIMFKDLTKTIDSMKGSSEKFSQKNPNGDKFIVTHLMGSHGPTYWKRYPKDMEMYSPTCDRSDIENCTDEEIVNTYDNTIVYTDYLISESIKVLKTYESEYNVAMVYVSDHGESLGENGVYLHGYPYALAPSEQTHVPFYIWMSSDFKTERKINEDCLREVAKTETVSHDNLFHSILGMSNVKTSLIDEDLDLSYRCKST